MRAGQGIVVISIALLMLGVVMVNSAGMQVSNIPLTYVDLLTSRPAVLAAIAMIVMFVGSRFPVQLFEKHFMGFPLVLWFFWVAVFLLFTVYIPGIGKQVNASNRWVEFGGFNFQPSEITKWMMVIALAWWSSKHLCDLSKYLKGFLPIIAIVGLVSAVIAIEDLGTAVLIFAVACFVLLAAGSKLWHFATFAPVAISGFYLAVYRSDYRMGRLQTYLDPFADPENSGYHIVQSMSAISEGGLSGLGLGNGIQKFGYLPEDTTDFIFAIICEELGAFGAIAVASLYVGLVWIGIYVIRKTSNTFHQLLVLGIIATIGLQASINILVVTSLVPTKGIALPLLSNGGTGWLLTAFCIGLIDAIDRKANASSTVQNAFPTTARA
ncbi:MAG: FtsW/RodA/SpoVE family cell cycle protein [Phycisphaerales bacterium]|jgi:cell division protein FtsW|nr:FtsW/RodA/SpoVE family cell cycle protein [Phycisphaerales bacterium]